MGFRCSRFYLDFRNDDVAGKAKFPRPRIQVVVFAEERFVAGEHSGLRAFPIAANVSSRLQNSVEKR